MTQLKTIISAFILFLFLSYGNSIAQWVEVPAGMYMHQAVFALAVNGNTVFAGCGYNGSSGIYSTTNNGINWTQAGLAYISVYDFTENGKIMYAGSSVHGAFVSTNYGISWSATSLNNRNVSALAVHGNTVFAGTVDYPIAADGLYSSTDNGMNWILTSLTNRNITALGISGNNILAGTDSSGIYLSTNNGATWSQTSLNNREAVAFTVGGNIVYAATSTYGVYKSVDNGVTWTQTNLNNQSVTSLAANGNVIFAGTNSNGVYVTTDNGTSWNQRNEGLIGLQATSLCIANGYLFAGSTYYTVFRRPLSELVSITPITEQVPSHFSLSQNYPNPFNPSTKIRFDVPSVRDAYMRPLQLIIYDMLGREIEILVDQQLQPGAYEVEWDASNYPSGVYFYKIISGDYTASKKMILVK